MQVFEIDGDRRGASRGLFLAVRLLFGVAAFARRRARRLPLLVKGVPLFIGRLSQT